MTKAVFTAKGSSAYDDLIEERYHFPERYLRTVESAVGDWIVYYEPRRVSESDSSRGGAQAYVATARVAEIVRDPKRPDHHYAVISDFLEFDHKVPFRSDGAYWERALKKDDGSTNRGAFGWSVRVLDNVEYEAIVAAGFANLLCADAGGVSEGDRWGWTGSSQPVERPRVPCVGERWFRDRAFTARVRSAYANRCAITRLSIRNGGGRPEVQAAHIRPVASEGPDSTRNGIALSGTVHWMFDRGLLSLEDDGRVLVAERSVPEEFRALLGSDRQAALPRDAALRPHPRFLRFHRETIFKG